MKRDASLLIVAPILVIASFVVVSIVRFAAAGRDDTLIMLWSGKTFTLRDWFINYNGAHEEMSSSVLAPWVASVGYWLAPSTPLLFFKTISLCVAAGGLILIWQHRRIMFHVNLSQALVPAVIFAIAISPMFEYWTLGGLDTPFQAFLLLLAPLTQVRFFQNRSMTNAVAFGLSLVLMSLVRTEGFIYLFASLAVPLAARERKGLLWLLTPIIAAGVITLGLIAVRFLFTGALWPNPTYAKIGGLFSQFRGGLGYVARYYYKGGLASQLQGVGTAYAAASLLYFGLIRKRQRALTSSELTTVAFSSCVVV